MFNPLPFLALGALAIGYAGAIKETDRAFATTASPTVAAFPATPNLSVQDFVGKLPETAQDPLCDSKEAVTASLSDDFAEEFEASWSNLPNAAVELWTSDLMGTWTVLHIDDAGLACIVSSGFGWEEGMGAETILQERPLS